MGGYGSGRAGWQDKVEDFKALDVGALRRAGMLKSGRGGNWAWFRGDEKVGWIGLRAEPGVVILSYRRRWQGGDWQDCTERVPLEWVPCTLGGARPYFRCPGVVNGLRCGRRVGKLFAGGQYFLCRHCYRLTYSSQSQPSQDRLLRKANKMRQALGGEMGVDQPICRPKGMWRRTFKRRKALILQTEMAADAAMVGHLRRAIARLKARRSRR